MKFFVYLTVFIGLCLDINCLYAQSAGFNSSYAIFSINGGANSYYCMNSNTSCGSNPGLNAANLGTFSGSNTLALKGGDMNIWKCNGADVSSIRLNYRIYPTASPSGSYNNITHTYNSEVFNGCSGADQKWLNLAANVDVLSGLVSGNYTIEIYCDATTTVGTQYLSNAGSNYKATFTVVRDYRSRAIGNWNSASTWEIRNGSGWFNSVSTTPGSTDGNVSILNGHTVTLSAAATLGNVALTIETGGILRSDNSLTIGSTGVFSIQNGGIYIHNNSSSMSTGIFQGTESFGATSTVEYRNLSAGGFVSAVTYGNFIYDHTASHSFPTTIVINGNFEIKQGSLDFGSTSRTIGGNATVSGGEVTFQAATINGNLSQTAGIARVSSNTSTSQALTVSGNFNLSGGTFHLNDASTAGSARNSDIMVGGSINWSAGTFSYPTHGTTASAGRILISGDFLHTGGALAGNLSTGTNTAGIYFTKNGGAQNIILSGSLTNGAGTWRDAFYYKTSSGPNFFNITFQGSVAQNTPRGTFGTPTAGHSRWLSAQNINNLTINNSSGVTVRDNITINGTLYRTIGSFTLSSSAISYASGATLEYNGNADITTETAEFPGSNGPSMLRLNLQSAGQVVTLHTTRTLSAAAGALTFVQGILSTGGNEIHVTNTAAGAVSGQSVSGGADKYVRGNLKRNITTGVTYDFPVGDAAHGHQSATLNFTNLNSSTWASASYTSSGATTTGTTKLGGCDTNADGILDTINYTIQSGVWQLSCTNPTSLNVEVNVYPAGLNPNGGLFSNLIHSGSLEHGCATIVAGTSSTGKAGLTSLSPFQGASGTVTLPVQLSYFSGKTTETYNLLEWETQSERNNSHFILQRSIDGRRFEDITVVNGVGNSDEINRYNYRDFEMMPGINYYRLQQVDYDGSFSYSHIIGLKKEGTNDPILWPNPSQGGFYVDFEGKLQEYEVVDFVGRIVAKASMGSETFIHLDLQNGAYLIKFISDEGDIYYHKLLIEK